MKAVQVYDGDGEKPGVVFDDAIETEVYQAIRDGYNVLRGIAEHLGRKNRVVDKALQGLRKRDLIYYHLGHRAWITIQTEDTGD